jgi:hypothetical protein
MKILFVTSGNEDFMADGLLHGLRSHYGSDCVDFPKAEHMYASFAPADGFSIHGWGFTLYTGMLEDIKIDRSLIEKKIRKSFFDIVIFGNIWNQYGLFAQWSRYLDPEKTIICDGADSPQVYPYAGLWWRRPSQWFATKAHKDFLYFKREWTEASQFNLWHRALPKAFWKHLPKHPNLRQISFSIPEEKIVQEVPEKTKDFATHCVDPEVAERIPGCKTSYAFKNEAEYYADLQASRFAITTKRAGWDCMRHYEISANGCIPCFKDLDMKPDTCAPHGLVDGVNCISYKSFGVLSDKIQALGAEEESAMCAAAIKWVSSLFCQSIAKKITNQIENA